MALTTVYTENFESYLVGDDLTTKGWTWHQWSADTATFTVAVGKYGKCAVTSGIRAGGFTLDSLSYLIDFTITFDVISYGSGDIFFGFRHAGGFGYWLDCTPGAAFGSILRRGNTNDPYTAYNLGSAHSPAVVTQIKIVVEGNSIKVYYNGSASTTHDITDDTYSAGTIAIGSTSPNWEVDNIVVEIPPTNISNVGYENVTSDSATITWDTDLAADSQVEYGLTPAYGNLSILQPALVTSHSVILSGLSPGNTYYYRVLSINITGTTISGNYTFQTLLVKNKYLRLLLSLLPLGKAWSRTDGAMPDLLNGMSQELSRVDDRITSLPDERDSCTTSDLLTEHEADLDIIPATGATDAERRITVRSILTAVGGADPQYFIDLAANMSYTITIDEFRPAWCGVVTAGEPCGDQEVIFVWRVNLVYSLDYIDPTGADLQARLEELKPAHTELIFRIVGVDYSNAFSILDFNATPITAGGDFNNRDFDFADFFVNHAGDFERIDFDKGDFKLYK